MKDGLVLMNARRIRRSVKRMGYEILEQDVTQRIILLFGINRRGFAVAELLKQVLDEIYEGEVRVVRLPLEEDLPQERYDRVSDQTLQDSLPIVVDDVIFSGQTMFRALKKITARWNPDEIHTAVMIDRGHRKFPIQAGFCGMELPTKLNEHVSVVVEEGDVKEIKLQK